MAAPDTTTPPPVDPGTPAPAAPATPQDKLPNAPFPNDPASVAGARTALGNDYIGPTNFATLQKTYTPYQIEQNTIKDAQGNISWKPGSDINGTPKSAPAQTFTAPTAPPTPTTDNLGSTAPAPNVTSDSTTANSAFAASQSAAAKNYLSVNGQAIDGLLAQQQQMEQAAKEAAQANVDKERAGLTALTTSTAQSDALKAARDLFRVKETISSLQTINSKIADASAALDQGLLYERSQPVRMALLTGRSAALQAQGIASIGALKSAAEVLKGNLDLAKTYADDTIAAVKGDNADQQAALTTLLTLDNSNLVKLTADEKATIDNRMGLLTDQSKIMEQNKTALLDYATKYPSAFAKGGVSFLDTPEQALAKMLPQMSADDRLKYDLEVSKSQLEIAQAKKNLASANKTSSGGNAPIGVADNVQNFIDAAFASNASLNDVIAKLNSEGVHLTAKQTTALKSQWTTIKANPTDAPITQAQIDKGDYSQADLGKTPADVQAAKDAVTAAHAGDNGGRGPGILNYWANVLSGPQK